MIANWESTSIQVPEMKSTGEVMSDTGLFVERLTITESLMQFKANALGLQFPAFYNRITQHTYRSII
jgi:hypothetical protein